MPGFPEGTNPIKGPSLDGSQSFFNQEVSFEPPTLPSEGGEIQTELPEDVKKIVQDHVIRNFTGGENGA